MSEDDILNKWLFLAYSHKKENRKTSKRYLGAKGIGRFSCDRLGEKVEITTKQKGTKLYSTLEVDWSRFEGVDQLEFSKIPVQIETREDINNSVPTGTVIKITSLRDKWDRESLLRLKRSLTKLVSPDELYRDIVKISIKAELENDHDKMQQRDRDIVNGLVRNDLYEVLRIKSVSLQSEVSNDGKVISFQLIDKGQRVFKVSTDNSEYESLQGVKMDIFFASPSVKRSFLDIMGMATAHYGNIFVFKNGFRILPYGEPANDFFEMNLRKQQGTGRYFGTRDLLGRIDIMEAASGFIEASSRDNGFVQTRQVEQLKKYFFSMMKILEGYVTKVIDWGKDDIEFNANRINIPTLIKQLTGLDKKNENVTLEYDEFLVKGLAKAAVQNSDSFALEQIKKLAINNNELSRLTDIVESKLRDLREEKTDTQKKLAEEAAKRQKLETQLDDSTRQNFFLQSAVDSNVDKLKQIIHLNMIFATKIDAIVASVFDLLASGKESNLKEKVAGIQLWATRIYSLSNVGAKTNFSLSSDKQINTDLANFINDYLQSYYKANSKIKVHVENLADNVSITFFASEILALVENLISNATKASAKNIFFKFTVVDGDLVIDVKDDGKGLHPDIGDIEYIFTLGYSKTGGSGIGLYQVKNIVTKMDGRISVLNEHDYSFVLRMEVKNGYKI